MFYTAAAAAWVAVAAAGPIWRVMRHKEASEQKA